MNTKDIKDSVADGAKAVADKAKYTADDINAIANELGQNVRNFLEHKQTQLNQAKSQCEEMIKDRPLASTAMAFAAGMLIGALIKRK